QKPTNHGSHSLGQFAFGPADGRNQQHGSFASRQLTKERNSASIRRPGWAVIVGWMSGETQVPSGTDEFDINIKVILLFTVPGESNLIAVGSKRRLRLDAWITVAWYSHQGRFRRLVG